MDFIPGLPRTSSGNDAIWIIIDRLTKSTHFLPGKMTFTLERLVKMYIREIVRLHGIHVSIVFIVILVLLLRFGEVCKNICVLD